LKDNQTHLKESGFPGLIISALRGGSGKTIFSVGIIAALTHRGYKIAPFKKGPDYIDAGWLALAADRPCYNLDTYLISKETIRSSFDCYVKNSDLAIVEGNRGLYDSIERTGQTSTAELAKFLDLPVILCIDGTKATRTMAAVVMGCQHFDPAVKIKGVILNRVAGPRHENNLRTCIEHYCDVPVLGAVPKLREQAFPERHMGLVPTPEHNWASTSIQTISDVISKHIDLEEVLSVAGYTGDLKTKSADANQSTQIELKPSKQDQNFTESSVCFEKIEISGPAPRIGVIRDSAFQFYYPENLESLTAAGGELVFTSPLSEATLPDIDALYIGGGFPETHAKELAENITYRNHIYELAQQGLPIYAECGGLMYLGKQLQLDDNEYDMVGFFPLVFDLHKRPQGHGYTIINVDRKNPFYAIGSQIRGHEFHYSKVIENLDLSEELAFQVERGAGIVDGRDGICRKNVLATYTHIHALGTRQWAQQLVAKARSFQIKRAYI
jgi:cobyrinic acid a,c-diamide synthase